jgi:ABC-type glycerol-3-phosphate transport system substrate-binding protein
MPLVSLPDTSLKFVTQRRKGRKGLSILLFSLRLGGLGERLFLLKVIGCRVVRPLARFFHGDSPGVYFCGLLVGLVVALAACTPPTPPPSPTPWPSPTLEPGPTPGATVPLLSPSQINPTPSPRPTLPSIKTASTTIITVWENLSPAQAQLLREDIEAFETKFPQYQVELNHYDSPENFMTPLMTGQLDFDIILASPVLLGSLWNANQLAPLSDFFPPSFLDAFAAVTLAGASRDDQLWGLPDTSGFHLLLFYNQDLVDNPPTHVEEFDTLAQSLVGGARWRLGVNSFDPLWLIPWLAPNGGWLTDEAGVVTLDPKAMEAALTLYSSWHRDGIAPVANYDEIRAKFLNGDIALVIDGEWAIGELATANKINWGVTRLPALGQNNGGQPAAPLVLGRYWAINRATNGNRVLAVAAFLEFITQPQRQLQWTSQFGLLPTRREALNDPQIINDPILRASTLQMQAGRTVPLGVNANTILDAMREPLRGVINGELTPQEAAEMMQANMEQR